MLRILLVEDEPDISLVVAFALEEAGHHVTSASDGLHGLEIARQEQPELIVTDFMMPRVDGLEMIERLRRGGYTHPIILTTAVPERHLPSPAGYDAFLHKPYEYFSLLQLIEALRPLPAR